MMKVNRVGSAQRGVDMRVSSLRLVKSFLLIFLLLLRPFHTLVFLSLSASQPVCLPSASRLCCSSSAALAQRDAERQEGTRRLVEFSTIACCLICQSRCRTRIAKVDRPRSLKSIALCRTQTRHGQHSPSHASA